MFLFVYRCLLWDDVNSESPEGSKECAFNTYNTQLCILIIKVNKSIKNIKSNTGDSPLGSVLFLSRPRSAGWTRHGRTFSIYLCPLSMNLVSWSCSDKLSPVVKIRHPRCQISPALFNTILCKLVCERPSGVWGKAPVMWVSEWVSNRGFTLPDRRADRSARLWAWLIKLCDVSIVTLNFCKCSISCCQI